MSSLITNGKKTQIITEYDVAKEILEKLNLKTFRKIQILSFNHIFDGMNIILECETGGGKTLAYLLPIICLYSKYKKCDRGDVAKQHFTFSQKYLVTTHIIVPTYELVNQISKILSVLEISHNIMAGSIARFSNVDFSLFTVGKYNKFMRELNTQKPSENVRSILVLDEADKLLTQNLYIYPYSQIILVSATIKDNIAKYLNDYTTVAYKKKCVSKKTWKIITKDSNRNEKEADLFQQKESSFTEKNSVGFISSPDFSMKDARANSFQKEAQINLSGRNVEIPSSFNNQQKSIHLSKSHNSDIIPQEMLNRSQINQKITSKSDSSVEKTAIISKDDHLDSITFYHIRNFSKLKIKNFFVQPKLLNLILLIQQYRKKNMIIFCNTINTVRYIYTVLKKFNLNIQQLHGKISSRRNLKENLNLNNLGILITSGVMNRGFDFKGVKIVIEFEKGSTDEQIHRRGRTGRDVKGSFITFYEPEPDDFKELIFVSGKFCKRFTEKKKTPGFDGAIISEKVITDHNGTNYDTPTNNIICPSENVHGPSRDIKKQSDISLLQKQSSTLKSKKESRARKKLIHILQNKHIHKMAVDALKSNIKYSEGHGITIEKNIHRKYGLSHTPNLDLVHKSRKKKNEP